MKLGRSFKLPDLCCRCAEVRGTEYWPVAVSVMKWTAVVVTRFEDHAVYVPICKPCLDYMTGRNLNLIQRLFHNPKDFVRWTRNANTLVFTNRKYQKLFEEANRG